MTREEFVNTEIKKSIAKDWDRESAGYKLAVVTFKDIYDLQQQIAELQEKIDERS